MLECAQGHVRRQSRAIGGGGTDNVSWLNVPGSVRALIRANFPRSLLQRLTIRRQARFAGGEQRRGELDVGEAQVAESGIALVVFPAIGLRDPGGRIRQDPPGNAITFSPGRVEGSRPIAIVVAGETTVVPGPGGYLAFEKLNCIRLGERWPTTMTIVADAPAGPARGVAAEVTRRKSFSRQNPPPQRLPFLNTTRAFFAVLWIQTCFLLAAFLFSQANT